MKTDLTTPGALLQSKARDKAMQESARKGLAAPLTPKPGDIGPDYRVELSSKASEASLPSMPSLPTPPAPSISAPELPRPESSESLAKDKIKDQLKDEAVDKAQEASKVEEVKAGTLKRPAIIFIKGLDVFSSPSNSETGYAGMGKIAESIEGSRLYGWDQKDAIIKEVMKTHRDFPVILVGHSFGGDTAVEVANELDTLENKFRPVDLLITVDAIGFNNDIIPQNVKKHLNIFGESSWFLNDGPHVARRHEMTEVKNILSPRDHTEIDDDKEIQFEIVGLIESTLKKT